jgi:DamX protein
VNYSSQLIFVSSASIAEQHRTLEAFIADQSELTEVAFITAEDKERQSSYRSQLCRQLIGQIAGSFSRPLNELLVSLNHYDGPILIGIKQAHYLPNSFLQELWDLVLQSRFAANKQHLNIVLFGDSQWAEHAQSWLPAKNTATPLLLSSESIDTIETDLEQLISQKRAAFQQRLADRDSTGGEKTQTIAIIKRPWFSLIVIGFFSLVFAALLSWQYPIKMQALLGFDTANITTAVSEVDSIDDQAVEIPQQPMLSDVTATPIVSGVTEQLLVSRWQTGVEDARDIADLETAANDSTPDSDTTWQALPDVDDSKYLIQLAGLKDIELALQYLTEQNLLEHIWLYKTQRYGGDWYVVVHNRLYDSLDDAQANIALLPPYKSQSSAFVKSSRQINAELNQ